MTITIEKVCLLAVTACAIALTFGLYRLVDESRNDEHATAIKVDTFIGSLDYPTKNALAQIAATGKVLSQVGGKERDAFGQQQTYYADLTGKTDKVLDSLDSAIRNVNDNTVARMDTVLDSLGVSIGNISDSGQRVGTDADVVLSKVAPMIQAATDDLADPHLKATAAHLDNTSANVEATSKDVKDFVHRETTPVRGTWAIIKMLLGLTYQSRGALMK